MTYFEKLTAVIVEDDPFIALDLQGILEDLGITVLKICPSVEEAVQAALTIEADIFTLDYELGKKTSDPVADELLEKEKKFIVISGKIEQLAGQSRFSRSPLLSKPVDPDALSAAISEIF